MDDLKFHSSNKICCIKNFSPPLRNLAEHILQIAIMSSSPEAVKNIYTGTDMFRSLVYTAWFYPGAAIW